MLIKTTKHEKDPQNGLEMEESTEIWVADFGNHELEQELRQEVSKIRSRSEANFSWIFVSVVLLVFVIVTELALRQAGLAMFWPEKQIFWATWLWRLVVILVWLYLARLRWLFSQEKMFITTIISYVAAIIVLGVIKIIYIRSVWAWLNLLVEPVWVIILIFLLGALIIKYSNKKNLRLR
ncbi:MAG: hypothetical protein Q8O32_02100 [bacterium]|nr:hypothetical protein [bacterium]